MFGINYVIEHRVNYSTSKEREMQREKGDDENDVRTSIALFEQIYDVGIQSI